MLTIENLKLTFENFSLNNINFVVEKGKIQTLLGPSGSGKSCILKCVAGVYHNNGGQILINDRRIDLLPPEDRNVGIVFQNETLFSFMNAYDNIAFGLKIRNFDKKEIEKKVDEYANLLGIAHLLKRKVDNLSGGEKQRVALARSLILEPKLLLLDEPFSALDTKIKEQLTLEFKRIFNLKNQTVLHVTHDHAEACVLAHKIAVIKDGIIEQNDSVYNIFNKPASAFVAEFVNTMNIFHGDLINKNGKSGFHYKSLEFYPEAMNTEHKASFSFRPESIQLYKKKPDDKKENLHSGQIVDIHMIGSLMKYFIKVGDINITALKLSNNENHSFEVNENVYMYIPPSNIHQLKN